jgi:hypothetical protein
MRTANVLKATRQIADEALYRSFFGGGGGGGDGPLPAATFTIIVNKGGNDATGDGTDEKPFLTIGKAMTVAAGIAPTFDQPALIQVGPGGYTESISWVPNVIVSGLDASTLGFFLNGSITLDLPLWVAAGAANLVLGGLDACEVGGNVTLNFTGVNAGGFFGQFFLGAKTNVDGDLSVTGDVTGAVGALFIIQTGSTIGGSSTFVGCSVETNLTLFAGATSFASSATVATSWQSFGDILNGIALSINASAGQNVSANLTGTGAGAGTTLTLTDGGGGHTSYTATAGGIPSTVTLVGGAAAPVPTSPVVGLNSTNSTGVAAAAGTVATADGVNGVTWSPAPGAFAFNLSTRGMTTFVNADVGVFNNAGAVPEWFDQAPSRVGQLWTTFVDGTTPATFNPAGFNGKATLDTLESPSMSQFQYADVSMMAGTFFLKPDEFTIAACVLYTGTKDWLASQLNPIIFASTQNGGGNRNGIGLTVGLDSATPGNVIFSVFINDSSGVNPPKFAESASVSGAVAHYVLGTLFEGNLSIYLDNNPPVTTAGVGPVDIVALSSTVGQITAGGASTSQVFQGHYRSMVAYCVGQTAPEIAQTLAFMKATGGL